MGKMSSLKIQLHSAKTVQQSNSSQALNEPLHKSQTEKSRLTSTGSSFYDILEQMANAPAEQDDQDMAPMSPDPRFNHTSKLVSGICATKKQSEEELEAERQRLRKQYLANRAETVLFEQKYGEVIPINYNEFC